MEVHRVPVRVGVKVTRASSASDAERGFPPLIIDPLEALQYTLQGENVAFTCPLHLITTKAGFNFCMKGWHPFVETLREYGAGEASSYKGSLLQMYYERHQPKHAAESLPNFDLVPSDFYKLPAHCRVAPWSFNTPSELDRRVRKVHKADNKEHGAPDMTVESDGYPFHGPVSMRKGRLEYQRLINIYQQLAEQGYDRSRGHVGVGLLKRGTDYRFLLQGAGFHRTPAMTALDHQTIPAKFTSPPIIDVSMISSWLQVRSGLWSKEEAISYVDHLFDFDSRSWARKHGLLQGNPSNPT